MPHARGGGGWPRGNAFCDRKGHAFKRQWRRIQLNANALDLSRDRGHQGFTRKNCRRLTQ